MNSINKQFIFPILLKVNKNNNIILYFIKNINPIIYIIY